MYARVTSPKRGLWALGDPPTVELSPVLPQLLSKGAFGYLLPIVSFVLAWLETWFLDFKVLPQEAEEERCECWGKGCSEGHHSPKRGDFQA